MSARKHLLILLLLAGCNSEENSRSGGGGAVPAAGDLDVQPAVPSPAALQARAQAAVSATILDPRSARYANIRAGSGGSICGDVDAKGENGQMQGFRPFVVSPEGVAVVSSASTIMFDNPADMFPDFYIRYCAPPEELPMLQRKMAEQVGANLPPPPAEPEPAPLPPGDLPLPDSPIMATPPAPPPGARKPAAPKAQPKAQPGDEDSFFNAVIREREEGK